MGLSKKKKVTCRRCKTSYFLKNSAMRELYCKKCHAIIQITIRKR